MYLIYLRRLIDALTAVINTLVSIFYSADINDDSRKDKISITGVGLQVITFKVLSQNCSLPSDNWEFATSPLFINNDGVISEVQVTSKTKSGFSVNIATAGYLEYEARWLGENVRYAKERIVGAGDQIITFSVNGKVAQFADANWVFCNKIRAYLDDGTLVNPIVSDRVADGFTVNIGGAGYIIYKVAHETVGEKARFERIAINYGVDNVIVFKRNGVVTPFPTTSWQFTGTPFCYDSSGILPFPLITNRTVNGFTINIGSAYFGANPYIEYECLYLL